MSTVKVKLADIPRPTKAELARIRAIKDKDIDYSEIPELDDAWFRKARAAAAASLQPAPLKVPIALRLDADVLAWFRAQGKGYQTQINAILRAYAAAQPKGSK
jgi:uncharacterized protein (DUF4415 family)